MDEVMPTGVLPGLTWRSVRSCGHRIVTGARQSHDSSPSADCQWLSCLSAHGPTKPTGKPSVITIHKYSQSKIQ